MARHVPFTAHIKVVPFRGKRQEHLRDLQKISEEFYDELDNDTDLNLALPGGGQHRSFSGVQLSGLGGAVNGAAIKPQIGQSPAQLQITGFLITSDNNSSKFHQDRNYIHANESITRLSSGQPYLNNPTSALETYVSSIKTKLETAMTIVIANLGGSDTWKVFRLEVAGVVYGDRGYTFPS